MSEAYSPLPSEIAQPEDKEKPISLLRNLFLVACIVFFVCVIAFLVYYNGKSIYDNGI